MRNKFEAWAKDYVKGRDGNDRYTSPYTQAAWEGWQAGCDVAFATWLEKLADEFRSTYGFTPLQVEQYVTQQPEVWRDYFNDDYTPADAAHEDALAGQD